MIKRKIKEESEDREEFCGKMKIDWLSNFKVLKHDRELKLNDNVVKSREK